ncbi:MAG: pentapeptide repeat-containing protein [Hyphomicrobiales bacterium]
MRNLHFLEAQVIKTMQMPAANVNVLERTTKIRGVSWRSLDLSSSRLPNVRFFDCKVEDCIFDRCRLSDFRVWGTDFSDVSFRSAFMRRAVLGGDLEGRTNTFRHVDFTSADMRAISCRTAGFVGCTFKNARLGVDFQSSTFTDCTFEGELREVIFNRRGFRGEAYPPNEMKGVDFRRAKLRWCAFRGLDLKDVRFPDDDDHTS